MKHGKLFVVLAAVFALAVLAGCNGGGGSQATTQAADGGLASSPDDGVSVIPPVADNPGTGEPGPGTVVLAWDAPATNLDGTPLTDLAGYRIHYGTSPGAYTGTVDAGRSAGCSVTGLAPGTYYIVVSAYNADGYEGSPSNEVTKVIL